MSSTSIVETFVPVSVVAAEVAEDHNNPAMEGWLRLYLEAIERTGFRVVRAGNASDKRVECGRCRNPYDEDNDALGVCAECLAEAFVPCTHDWVRCVSCRQRVLTGSEGQHRCPLDDGSTPTGGGS